MTLLYTHNPFAHLHGSMSEIENSRIITFFVLQMKCYLQNTIPLSLGAYTTALPSYFIPPVRAIPPAPPFQRKGVIASANIV